MQNKTKGSSLGIIVIIIMILAAIGSCTGKTSSSNSATCQVCGKTFTNKDDVRSIAFTNMCEPCYENYKFYQEAKEAITKYNERYGD